MTKVLISKTTVNGDDITLYVENGRFIVYDDYNDFQCSFPISSIKKVLAKFDNWSTVNHTEVNTASWNNDIGYKGNWIKIKRIPHIITLISEGTKFKKRSKSELKRLATSTIMNQYSLLKALVDTKK
jgi:hypothetical protein